MTMPIPMLRKLVASALIITTMNAALGSPAHAGVVGTETALAPDRQAVLQMLARPEVRAALEARGVDAEDARMRVAAMSDAEIAQIGAQLGDAPAGGNIGEVLLFPIFAVVGFAKVIELMFGLVALAVRGVAYSVSR